MSQDRPSTPGSWKNRRRFMVSVTLFICAFMVFTVLYLGDTPTTSTVVTMGFTAITGIVGSYVFGAVWDHREARKAQEYQGYQQPQYYSPQYGQPAPNLHRQPYGRTVRRHRDVGRRVDTNSFRMDQP